MKFKDAIRLKTRRTRGNNVTRILTDVNKTLRAGLHISSTATGRRFSHSTSGFACACGASFAGNRRSEVADIFLGTHDIGLRVFDVLFEGFGVIKELDIYAEVGGYAALTKAVPTSVSDGMLTIEFLSIKQSPKISAIEIEPLGTAKAHQAHSVPGGPYFGVDTDNDGFASVLVDGTFSHTHGPGARLFRWKWFANNTNVGSGEATTLRLPVGTHHLVLEVTDTDMDVSTDYTSVTVL